MANEPRIKFQIAEATISYVNYSCVFPVRCIMVMEELTDDELAAYHSGYTKGPYYSVEQRSEG